MFRTGQPKFTRLVLGLSLSAVLAVAVSGCGGGGGGGNSGGGGGGFTVTGQAVDAATPQAVESAAVYFRSDASGTASQVGTTDANGNFSVTGGGTTGLQAGATGAFFFLPPSPYTEASSADLTITTSGALGQIPCTSGPPPPHS